MLFLGGKIFCENERIYAYTITDTGTTAAKGAAMEGTSMTRTAWKALLRARTQRERKTAVVSQTRGPGRERGEKESDLQRCLDHAPHQHGD